MAQERKHFLINPHTSSVDSMPTNLQLGEIAVRHANENPELIIKKNDGTFATFVDKSVISALDTNLSGQIEAVAGDVAELSGATKAGLEARYTKDEADAAFDVKGAAASALTEAKTHADNKVASAVSEVNASIEAVAGDVAKLSGATVTLANSAVTSIEIKGTEDAQSKQTVTATIVNNKATFDFTNMVIDCGTF